MGFRQVVVAGTDLVREAIRSPGFVSGIFGWTINRDGTAEFSSASFRGSLTVGIAPAPQIVIIATGNPGQPFILFYTHGANETAPAQIHSGTGAGGDYGIEIDSNEYSGGGQISTIWFSPSGVNSQFPTKTGGIVQTAHFNGAVNDPATFALSNDIGLYIAAAGGGISPMALTAGNYPIQIGPDSAQNLRMNFQQIQAVNNGVAATLFLNDSGGTVSTGSDLSVTGDLSVDGGQAQVGLSAGNFLLVDGANRNFQAANAGAAATMFLQNSGGNIDFNNPAGGQGLRFATGVIQAITAGVAATLFLNNSGGNIRMGQSGGAFTEVQAGQIFQSYNAGTPTTMFLQYQGGNIRFSGNGTDFIELQTGRIIQAYSAASAPTTLLLNNAGGVVFIGGSGLTNASGVYNNSVSPPTTGTAVNTTLVNTSGTIWQLQRFTSSRQHKENITDLDVSVEDVLALRPRIFQRNDHRDYTLEEQPVLPVTEDTPWDVGFIAEEAEELGLDMWVQRNTEGEVEGFAYATFVAAQQVVLRQHQERIAQLEARLAALGG